MSLLSIDPIEARKLIAKKIFKKNKSNSLNST